MNFSIPHFSAALPEMFILMMGCLALLVDLFVKERYKSLSYYIVQLALIGAFGFTLHQLGHDAEITFSGNFISDHFSALLKLSIYIASFGAFWYGREYISDRDIPFCEYYVLGLFSVLGMMVLVSAYSLLTIFLGLELLSLPLYAMVALERDSKSASEAAIKYFVMGAIASAMLLYGMSMLYGATGSIEIDAIARVINTAPAGSGLLFAFGLVFIVVGIGFKFAAVPFHMWAPDVYQGAPASVTVFLGSVPKLAALGMSVRLLVNMMPHLMIQWQELLIVMAILSMGLGNFIAIAQTNIKRMLAYSGIAHVGYLFLGLLVGTEEGYAAALFYILIYALMSLGRAKCLLFREKIEASISALTVELLLLFSSHL